MNPFLIALLKDIVAPELAAYFKSKLAATGELPTDAELDQKIADLATHILTNAQALEEQIYKDHPELRPTT